jgi:signal transduction histidine kinase
MMATMQRFIAFKPQALAIRPHLFTLSLVAWAIVALVALAGQLSMIDRPFPGFWVEHSGHLGATDLAEWTGPSAGLRQLDQIVSVDGGPFGGPEAIADLARSLPVGTPIRYGLSDGRMLAVPTMRYALQDFLKSGLTWWIAAVVHLVLGAWVSWRRPELASARAHWIYCQIFATFLLGGVLGLTWPSLTPINYVGTALMVPGIALLGLAFPQSTSPGLGRLVRGTLWVVSPLMLGWVALAYAWAPAFVWMFRFVLLLPSIVLVATLGAWTWMAASRRFSARVRAQALIAVAGMGVSLVPSLVIAAFGAAGIVVPGWEYAFVGFCAFPAAISYAIARHQAFDLDRMVRRATLYALLTASLGALYVGAASLGFWALGQWATEARRAGLAGFVGAVAVAATLRPLEAWLRMRVDRFFLGHRADPLHAAAALGAHAASMEAAPTLALDLARVIKEVLGAEWVSFMKGAYPLASAGAAGPTPALVVPLSGVSADRLEVGPRADEMPYTERDGAIVRMLGSQAVLGLDRAALFEERLKLEVSHAEATAQAEARETLFLQVVHDLGTDLSNIAVSADLARQCPGDAAPLDSIEASLSRIERFLSEKRRGLQAAGHGRRTPLQAGVELAIATVAPAVTYRAQRLSWGSGVPAVAVPLSEVELAQVIGNVLSNAVKFSPEGAVIRLSAALAGPAVTIAVEDAGPGIPAGLLGMLGSGLRADPAAQGPGLGLANAVSLVKPVGGHVSWRNGEAGAIVEVTLPIALA